MKLSNEKLKWMFENMVKIRLFEEAAIETYHQKLWKGSLHACIGQEAVAVGAGAAIEPTDYFVGTHRGHGHVLAKGVEADSLMAELFGRENGCCHGRGGSMHSMVQEKRAYPNGLVGSSAYIAAGIGMQINYNKTNEVVVAFMGDGAINAGGCHEGMNLAAIQKAPVIFICENNGIAVSTKIENMIPLEKISQRAAGYGMQGVTVDGTDILEVYETVMGFIDHVRGGEGPVFIEAVCHRASGHTAWDPAQYRSEAENNEWKKHDPIKKLKQKLLKDNIFSLAELEVIQKEVEVGILRAVEFAKNGPEIELTAEEALRYVYA